jgi:alpha-glucosidase
MTDTPKEDTQLSVYGSENTDETRESDRTGGTGKSDGTRSLPVTRRSVLRGAAAIGPVAGLLEFDEAVASATSTSSESATVSSPDGTIEATIKPRRPDEIGDDLPPGRIFSLTVVRDGTTVLEPSPLGITTLTGQFVTSLSLEAQSIETVDHTYETVGGDESGQQTLYARVGTFVFGSKNGVMKLELLVSNDGVAYRYHLPGDGHAVVTNETSAFQVPEDSQGWLLPYNNRYEAIWEEMDIGSASGDFGFPFLVEIDDDTYTLVTEANVGGRYCASHVAVDAASGKEQSSAPRGTSAVGEENDQDEIIGGNEEIDYDTNPYLFEVRFAGTYGLPEMVDAPLPLATPWRVSVIGDLGTVVESNLVTALNESTKLDDTSWIKPGRIAWSWWSDGDSPRSLATQKKYVDYASELGWEYTLVDRGWRREWISELVEYANERDVGILAWLPWYYLNSETKRNAILPRLKSWGVSGIKVDYMNSDFQQRMEWYDEILAATAEHGLMINFHGSTMPKGRRRTWPHLMTSEAVHGAEQYKFGKVPPTHNAILPYTRNVVGPMDYTPVTFSASDKQPETTPGHELGLSVVYQSDWQHFADSVESYRDHPLAEQFLSEVAAVWDETKFVGGQPAKESTFARRSGKQWFIGTIVAGEARTVKVPLSFLSDDQRYAVRLISDASGDSLELHKTIVTADETISVDVPENGGFAARLYPCGGTTDS